MLRTYGSGFEDADLYLNGMSIYESIPKQGVGFRAPASYTDWGSDTEERETCGEKVPHPPAQEAQQCSPLL